MGALLLALAIGFVLYMRRRAMLDELRIVRRRRQLNADGESESDDDDDDGDDLAVPQQRLADPFAAPFDAAGSARSASLRGPPPAAAQQQQSARADRNLKALGPASTAGGDDAFNNVRSSASLA